MPEQCIGTLLARVRGGHRGGVVQARKRGWSRRQAGRISRWKPWARRFSIEMVSVPHEATGRGILHAFALVRGETPKRNGSSSPGAGLDSV